MADVIQLKDGTIETVFNTRDLLDLIGNHMGFEIQRLLEERLEEPESLEAYIDNLEKDADDLRARYKDRMAELREQSEIIARLIREKDIDRRTLSTAVGAIGSLTRKDL